MNGNSLSPRALAWLKFFLFVAALLPLAKLMWGGLTDALGANPIERITHNTGYWTLTFLMLTLSATPLRLLFGWYWPVRLRRMLGLYAFFYACLHFLTYLVLDQFFDWQAIGADIVKRPYITIGFVAFLLLIPLAATSTDRMLRRLGGRRWQALHKLVYLIALGGVVHFAWLVKKDLTRPLEFACVLVGLLFVRWVHQHLRIRLRLKTAH